MFCKTKSNLQIDKYGKILQMTFSYCLLHLFIYIYIIGQTLQTK